MGRWFGPPRRTSKETPQPPQPAAVPAVPMQKKVIAEHSIIDLLDDLQDRISDPDNDDFALPPDSARSLTDDLEAGTAKLLKRRRKSAADLLDQLDNHPQLGNIRVQKPSNIEEPMSLSAEAKMINDKIAALRSSDGLKLANTFKASSSHLRTSDAFQSAAVPSRRPSHLREGEESLPSKSRPKPAASPANTSSRFLVDDTPPDGSFSSSLDSSFKRGQKPTAQMRGAAAAAARVAGGRFVPEEEWQRLQASAKHERELLAREQELLDKNRRLMELIKTNQLLDERQQRRLVRQYSADSAAFGPVTTLSRSFSRGSLDFGKGLTRSMSRSSLTEAGKGLTRSLSRSGLARSMSQKGLRLSKRGLSFTAPAKV